MSDDVRGTGSGTPNDVARAAKVDKHTMATVAQRDVPLLPLADAVALYLVARTRQSHAKSIVAGDEVAGFRNGAPNRGCATGDYAAGVALGLRAGRVGADEVTLDFD